MDIVTKLKEQPDRIQSLHNKFKGETCVIAGCSPFLLDHGKDKVKKLLDSYYSIALKQAYDIFPDSFDAHVYNCCNFKKYKYPKNKPLVVESSTLPPSNNDFDLYFLIQERDPSNTLAAVLDARGDIAPLSHWDLSGTSHNTKCSMPFHTSRNDTKINSEIVDLSLRPYGPGILSEIVFYLSVHLGFSRVILIGCDITHKKGVIHFYRDNTGAPIEDSSVEKNDPHRNAPWMGFNKEKELFINSLTYWQQWFLLNESKLETISNCSPMPPCITRASIDELL
jgi:hypothetical protein